MRRRRHDKSINSNSRRKEDDGIIYSNIEKVFI